jgi:hypothetical protein
MRDTLYTYINERKVVMTLESAEKLKAKMPWKQIFFDTFHNCYRLIHPKELHEYQDEEGKWYKRSVFQIKNLIPINQVLT